jgi:hypothetical protein
MKGLGIRRKAKSHCFRKDPPPNTRGLAITKSEATTKIKRGSNFIGKRRSILPKRNRTQAVKSGSTFTESDHFHKHKNANIYKNKRGLVYLSPYILLSPLGSPRTESLDYLEPKWDGPDSQKK